MGSTVTAELTLDEKIAALEAKLKAAADTIAEKEADIEKLSVVHAINPILSRRETYDALRAQFAECPELVELMRNVYLNVRWKFIGRTALGQSFEKVNGI